MPMTCRDVETQLALFVDGELSEAVAVLLVAHLDCCEGCRCLAQLERIGRQLLKEHAACLGTPAPASCIAAVRRAILRAR